VIAVGKRDALHSGADFVYYQCGRLGHLHRCSSKVETQNPKPDKTQEQNTKGMKHKTDHAVQEFDDQDIWVIAGGLEEGFHLKVFC